MKKGKLWQIVGIASTVFFCLALVVINRFWQSEQLERMGRGLRVEKAESLLQEAEGRLVQDLAQSDMDYPLQENEEYAITAIMPLEAELPGEEELTYPERVALPLVEKPRARSREEILNALQEMGAADARMQIIYENYEKYPNRMLENLVNNPEMTDFAVHFTDEEHTDAPVLTAKEKNQRFPLFLQWDPRWGYHSYGSGSTIAVSGCGPVCLSMVLYSLTGNEALTPVYLADYAMEKGYHIPGYGTSWSFMTKVPPLFGVDAAQIGKKEETMKAELDKSRLLIVSVRPGDFTVHGHFIEIYGYDEEGFWVNDPNCVFRSRQKWSYEVLRTQMKSVWSFGI